QRQKVLMRKGRPNGCPFSFLPRWEGLLAATAQTEARGGQASAQKGDGARLGNRGQTGGDGYDGADAAENAFGGPDGGDVAIEVSADDGLNGGKIEGHGEVVNVAVDCIGAEVERPDVEREAVRAGDNAGRAAPDVVSVAVLDRNDDAVLLVRGLDEADFERAGKNRRHAIGGHGGDLHFSNQAGAAQRVLILRAGKQRVVPVVEVGTGNARTVGHQAGADQVGVGSQKAAVAAAELRRAPADEGVLPGRVLAIWQGIHIGAKRVLRINAARGPGGAVRIKTLIDGEGPLRDRGGQGRARQGERSKSSDGGNDGFCQDHDTTHLFIRLSVKAEFHEPCLWDTPTYAGGVPS